MYHLAVSRDKHYVTCTWVYPDPATVLAFPAPGNPASFCIPIPDLLSLVHLPLTLQGLALDPAQCFRATDGVVVRVQRDP